MPRVTKSVPAPATPAKAAKSGKASPVAAPKAPAAKTAAPPKPPTAPASASKRSGSRKMAEPEAQVQDKFLQEQHSLLLAERASYVRQAESLREEAEQLAADMEPGDIQFDEESGEGGTMNIERERDLALSAQARAAVDEIDRALAKVANGSYGVCEGCGEPIKRARLKALPYASLCVDCKSGGLSRR